MTYSTVSDHRLNYCCSIIVYGDFKKTNFDGLSQSVLYGNFPLYVLARLFESFSEQSLSDVGDRRSD